MDGDEKQVNTAKLKPVDQSISEEKQQIIAPMAMADLEIMKAESAKSTASHNPEVRNIALLLIVVLGVTLLSQISSFLMAQSFSTTHTSFLSAFVNTNGFLGIALLLIQMIAIFILLFTRNISLVKAVILLAGVSFGVTLVKGILSFGVGPTMLLNFATLVVNFLILRKIFKAYLNL